MFSTDERVEAISTVFRPVRRGRLGLPGADVTAWGRPAAASPFRTEGRIGSAAATYPAVHDFLTNPCHAGAFVFGRNRSEKLIDVEAGW